MKSLSKNKNSYSPKQTQAEKKYFRGNVCKSFHEIRNYLSITQKIINFPAKRTVE